jgi:hypothetical protein
MGDPTMPKSSIQPKEESLNFCVPAKLKAAFQVATEAEDRPAAQVIRDFMRAYVVEHQQPEAGYDDWLRKAVQAAIDDPRPNVPHDAVMGRMRALIDQLAAEKASRDRR